MGASMFATILVALLAMVAAAEALSSAFVHRSCTNRPDLDPHTLVPDYQVDFHEEHMDGHLCATIVAPKSALAELRTIAHIVQMDSRQPRPALIPGQRFVLDTLNLSDRAHLPGSVPCKGGVPCVMQCPPLNVSCHKCSSNNNLNQMCNNPQLSASCQALCRGSCQALNQWRPCGSTATAASDASTLRIDQAVLLGVPANANGRQLDIVKFCVPDMSARTQRLELLNFRGHVVHCADFTA
jgi:hypothetical protein